MPYIGRENCWVHVLLSPYSMPVYPYHIPPRLAGCKNLQSKEQQRIYPVNIAFLQKFYSIEELKHISHSTVYEKPLAMTTPELDIEKDFNRAITKAGLLDQDLDSVAQNMKNRQLGVYSGEEENLFGLYYQVEYFSYANIMSSIACAWSTVLTISIYIYYTNVKGRWHLS